MSSRGEPADAPDREKASFVAIGGQAGFLRLLLNSFSPSFSGAVDVDAEAALVSPLLPRTISRSSCLTSSFFEVAFSRGFESETRSIVMSGGITIGVEPIYDNRTDDVDNSRRFEQRIGRVDDFDKAAVQREE